MVKPEWGIKRICPNCGTRYYDFRKAPPVCPACSTVYDPEALLKSRRARPGIPDEPKRATAKAGKQPVDTDLEEIAPDALEDADLDVEGESPEDDETLIEDTDDLDGGDITADVEVEDDSEN